MPGLVVAGVAAALVIAGVVPLSTILSAGMIGGMLLMHLGGHGSHGGHGGADKPGDHGRAARPGDQEALTKDGNDVDHEGQPGSRGCH